MWLVVVPYIRVMPPASDLCALCQENATLILKTANLSEDEKTKLLTDAQEHLKSAKLQRAYYNECVKSSQSSIDKVQLGEQPMTKVLSTVLIMHTSCISQVSQFSLGLSISKLQGSVEYLGCVLRVKISN